MRNKVYILSLSFIMVLCSSFSVFASTTRVVSFAEPSTSDTQGYLAVMDSNEDCNVFFWSIQPYSYSAADNRGSIPSMNLTLKDNSLQFTALCTGSARVTLTRVFNSSSQVVCMSKSFTTSTSYTYTGMTNIGYYCYAGNVGVVDDNISSSTNYLSMIWGDSESYQSDFDNLASKLSSIDSVLDNLYSRLGTSNVHLSDIKSYIDTLESKFNNNNELLDDILYSLELFADRNAGNVEDILAYIDDCRDELDGISGDIKDIENFLELTFLPELQRVNENLIKVENELVELGGKLDSISSQLDTSNGFLEVIDRSLDDIEVNIDNMLELMEELAVKIGTQDTSPLDDFSIDDLEDNEKHVISDKSQELDNLGFNFGNSFDTVWDMISRAWQSNSKVFTIVIMCLTVGLIKLILNR